MALFSKKDQQSRPNADAAAGAAAGAKGAAAKGADANAGAQGKKSLSDLMKTEINIKKTSGDVLPGGGTLPTKTTMNLYQTSNEDTKKRSRILLIFGIAAVILVVILAVMFIRVGALKAQVASLNAELNTYEAQLVDYDSINREYTRYSDGYLTRDQSALVDRMTVLGMVESAVAGQGEITSISVMDNKVTAVVATSSLEAVSSIRRSVEASNIVYKVSVETANYNTSKNSATDDVVSTMTIMVSKDGKVPPQSADPNAKKKKNG